MHALGLVMILSKKTNSSSNILRNNLGEKTHVGYLHVLLSEEHSYDC